MAGTLATVFRKEVLDNFRDRRTLTSALLLGPLFGPIIFGFVITLSVEQSIGDVNEPVSVPIIGSGHAPHLVAYLKSRNIDDEMGPATRAAALAAVRSGEEDLVVVVPEAFGDELASGTPATVEIITDQANRQSQRTTERTVRALAAYGQELASLRLLARGVDPTTVRPLNVDQVDVSTPTGRSALLLGMLSYFFLFALLTGGMNLAIDATAGERERGSLEPLLSLPVTRGRLILGKIFAACLFMATSLAICLVSFAVTLRFMPLEKLGMTANFGPGVIAIAFLVLVPFTLLGSSLMTLVASFTRSYKEAQTWMSIVLLAPTMPILVVSILMVRPSAPLMLVPSLSQHLLIVDLIKDEPLAPLNVLLSVSSTLALGALLAFACARLYRREGLLG